MKLGKIIKIVAAVIAIIMFFIFIFELGYENPSAPIYLGVGIGSGISLFILGEVIERLQSIDTHLDNIEYILTNTIWSENQQ